VLAATDLYFCVHTQDEIEQTTSNEEINRVTFCPIGYWDKNECLPDYYFSDDISLDLPEGYNWYPYAEESQWITRKNKDEIIAELTVLGLTSNKEMKEFLSSCWE
jgi:hypothetical protein